MIQEQEVKPIVVAALAGVTNLPKIKVRDCFKYNIMTPQQIAFVTGMSIFSIETKIRENKLTAVYPFSTDKFGPKFVKRDEKFEAFISDRLLKNG